MPLLAAGAAEAGTIAQDLEQELGRGGMHSVIVRMKDQGTPAAEAAGSAPGNRRERAAMVIQKLRNDAERSQALLRSRIAVLQTRGAVRARWRPLWIVNGIALTASAEAVRELAARSDVRSVEPDRVVTLAAPLAPAPVTVQPGWNLQRIGAQALWDAGYTGQDTVVAVLDTGVDADHPDLGPKWRGGNNSWFDPFLSTAAPYDVNGHGTWTTGLLAGGDTIDHLIGVAPGAKWIAAKIFSDAGTSTYSIIHEAFAWVMDPDGEPLTDDAPQVVNCSWTISSPGNVDLEFQPDIQALRSAGLSVVFAAGNDGPLEDTSVSPANYPESLSAGMTDSSDTVDPRSSRGPSAMDGTSVFPSLAAPGAGVRTTDLWSGSLELGYITVDGTSFAAPHVAGALALLASGNPGVSAGEREAALLGSAFDLGEAGPDSAYGNGFLSVDDAARQLGILAPLPLPSGDVNGNGAADLADVLAVLREALRMPATVDVRKRVLAEGDMYPRSGADPAPDGMIMTQDALTLLRQVVNGN